MVCLHTSFSHLNLPHAPKAGGLLLDYDLGHLVGSILQVVTPPPAASSGLLLLQHVAYLGVSGIESSRQRPAFFPRVGLGCGTFTRESVSRVTRSCEKRTDADALTGPPSCSTRLRRSACTFSGTSSSAPSPVSADTPSRVGVTSQLSTCRTVRVRKAPARSGRRPTPLQTARWNAVQKAKRRGLSIRRVAREVGILRDTAKKYMEAVSPPMKLDSGRI